MKINTHLKNARKKTGLTQVQVAEQANISETSYQRIEYGQQQPSLITALLIAKALNTTVEQIFPLPQRQLREIEKQPDDNQVTN